MIPIEVPSFAPVFCCRRIIKKLPLAHAGIYHTTDEMTRVKVERSCGLIVESRVKIKLWFDAKLILCERVCLMSKGFRRIWMS